MMVGIDDGGHFLIMMIMIIMIMMMMMTMMVMMMMMKMSGGLVSLLLLAIPTGRDISMYPEKVAIIVITAIISIKTTQIVYQGL